MADAHRAAAQGSAPAARGGVARAAHAARPHARADRHRARRREIRRALDELEREVLVLDDLVGRLLASSRLEFGNLDRRPLDLGALVTDVATSAGRRARGDRGDRRRPRARSIRRWCAARSRTCSTTRGVHGGGAVAVRIERRARPGRDRGRRRRPGRRRRSPRRRVPRVRAVARRRPRPRASRWCRGSRSRTTAARGSPIAPAAARASASRSPSDPAVVVSRSLMRDLERPLYRDQRPWFEIWFAVVLDADRRRALWVRQTMFVPKQGEGARDDLGRVVRRRRDPPTRAAKRMLPVVARCAPARRRARSTSTTAGSGARGATGAVDDLAWERDLERRAHAHARRCRRGCRRRRTRARSSTTPTRPARVTVGGDDASSCAGRALAMHLWGKRRVPTLHWIWAPWLGDASLEMTADLAARSVRARPRDAARSTGRHPLRGRPATAAHPHGLVTATVAGPRRLVHARAWAEPEAMVGYAYRDTDDRDLMVAQSDIGSAHYEVCVAHRAGRAVEARRRAARAGGVAVEIHQRTRAARVDYLAWDDDERRARDRRAVDAPARRRGRVARRSRRDRRARADVRRSRARDRRQGRRGAPPVTFAKHLRTLVRGDAHVPVARHRRAARRARRASSPGSAAQLARAPRARCRR